MGHVRECVKSNNLHVSWDSLSHVEKEKGGWLTYKIGELLHLQPIGFSIKLSQALW